MRRLDTLAWKDGGLIEELISGYQPTRYKLPHYHLQVIILASAVNELLAAQNSCTDIAYEHHDNFHITLISSWTQRHSFNSQWRCAGNHKISNETKIPIR